MTKIINKALKWCVLFTPKFTESDFVFSRPLLMVLQQGMKYTSTSVSYMMKSIIGFRSEHFNPIPLYMLEKDCCLIRMYYNIILSCDLFAVHQWLPLYSAPNTRIRHHYNHWK